MPEKETGTISYFQYEEELYRMERVQIRLFIACIIILIAFVVTNTLWVFHWIEITQ